MKVLRVYINNIKPCFNDLFEVFENMPCGQMCAVFNEGVWVYIKPYTDIYMDFPPRGLQAIDLDELEVEEEDAIELKFDMLVPISHSFVSFAPSPKIMIARELTHGLEQKFFYIKKSSLAYGEFFIDKETSFYIFL